MCISEKMSYHTIILHNVLYGCMGVCETYPLVVREEHKFRIFENRAWREDLYERGKKV